MKKVLTKKPNMSYRSFEDLEVWKQACRLAVRIYGYGYMNGKVILMR
jgi:hypothetical protein